MRMRAYCATVTAVAITTMVLLLAAASQPDETLAQLSQRVDSLTARVAKLEGGGTTGSAPTTRSSSGSAPGQTMYVDSISQATHSDDNSGDVAQLQREITSMSHTLKAQEKNVSNADSRQIVTELQDSTVRTDRGDVDRNIESNMDLAGRYATQLSLKKQQLERMQRAASQPKQIILGHNGSKLITLQSKYNIQRELESIRPGDLVTWSGQMIDSDDKSERWSISSIKVASN